LRPVLFKNPLVLRFGLAARKAPDGHELDIHHVLPRVAVGDVYYVQGEILWGFPAGRPKFSQKPESQALADIKKL